MEENKIGNMLFSARKMRKMTLKQVAEKLRISTGHVQKIEKGERIASDLLAFAIEEFASRGIEQDTPADIVSVIKQPIDPTNVEIIGVLDRINKLPKAHQRAVKDAIELLVDSPISEAYEVLAKLTKEKEVIFDEEEISGGASRPRKRYYTATGSTAMNYREPRTPIGINKKRHTRHSITRKFPL